MLSGAQPGTGDITHLTGVHGARTTGTTTTVITTTGTIITTITTGSGMSTGTRDTQTFITGAYGHIPHT